MKVVLWRHGRTGHNAAGLWQGQLDVPMDETGIEQAKRAAAALHELYGTSIVRLVSSDLKRAAATADALGERTGLPVTLDTRLREVAVGSWQGITRDEIVLRGEGEVYAAWRRGENVRAGGASGETRREAAARGAAAILDAVGGLVAGQTLVVVSHGAVLKGAILQLIGAGVDAWTTFVGMTNASWVVLEPDGDKWLVAGRDCVADDLI
jgi:probable phosphoglycerate mutase